MALLWHSLSRTKILGRGKRMKNNRLIIAIVVLSCQLNCLYASNEGEMIVNGARSVLGDFLSAATAQETNNEVCEAVEEALDPTVISNMLDEGQIVSCAELLAEHTGQEDFRKLMRIQIINRLNCLLVKVGCGLRHHKRSKWDLVDILWLGRDNLQQATERGQWPISEIKLAKAIVIFEKHYGKITVKSQRLVLKSVARVFKSLLCSMKGYTKEELAHCDRELGRLYIATAIKRALPLFKELTKAHSRQGQFKSVSLNDSSGSLHLVRKRFSSLWKLHKGGGCSFVKAVKLTNSALNEMRDYLASIQLHKEAYSI